MGCIGEQNAQKDIESACIVYKFEATFKQSKGKIMFRRCSTMKIVTKMMFGVLAVLMLASIAGMVEVSGAITDLPQSGDRTCGNIAERLRFRRTLVRRYAIIRCWLRCLNARRYG